MNQTHWLNPWDDTLKLATVWPKQLLIASQPADEVGPKPAADATRADSLVILDGHIKSIAMNEIDLCCSPNSWPNDLCGWQQTRDKSVKLSIDDFLFGPLKIVGSAELVLI